MIKLPSFVITSEIGLNDQGNDYVISKMVKLVAKDPKVLVTMIKLPSFVIKIEIGLNDQYNYSVCGIQGGGTGC